LAALRDALSAAARSNETISEMAEESADFMYYTNIHSYLHEDIVGMIVGSIRIRDTPIEPPSPAPPPPGTALSITQQ
jgi:hypothetical protein